MRPYWHLEHSLDYFQLVYRQFIYYKLNSNYYPFDYLELLFIQLTSIRPNWRCDDRFDYFEVIFNQLNYYEPNRHDDSSFDHFEFLFTQWPLFGLRDILITLDYFEVIFNKLIYYKPSWLYNYYFNYFKLQITQLTLIRPNWHGDDHFDYSGNIQLIDILVNLLII